MSIGALARFVLGVIAAALVAHLITSTVAASALYASYSHRIFDVRRFSNDAVANFRLVGTFLKSIAVRQSRPVIVFAGSSVTFGYQWDERVTFPSVFAGRHSTATVVNASIIAADVSAMNDWIVCAARRNQITVDTVVIELPVVNSLSYLAGLHRRGFQPAPLSTCAGAGPDRNYVGLAATTVRGAGWARFLWNGEHSATNEQHISIGPVPKDYFASAADFAAVKSSFSGQIATTLTNAKAIARVVYAFPSPVFIAGLRQIGEDADGVEEQLRTALEACQAVAGVQCVDPSPFYSEPTYFGNLTHLNVAGHRAMADLLDVRMSTP